MSMWNQNFNKWTSLCMMVAILMTTSFQFPLRIKGSQVVDLQKISNAYINVWVNPANGRFALTTNEGSPFRDKDQQQPLLYEGGDLNTSFVTFRIDGKDYIFGNTYNNKYSQGGLVQKPQVSKGVHKAIWRLNNVYVTQELRIESNENSATSGNVRIRHTVVNKGTKPITLGSRLLLDGKIGNEDGASIQIPMEGFINRETAFEAEKVPTYYTLTKSGNNLDVLAYHQLVDWEGTKPDKLVFAHWNDIGKTKWDYALVQGRTITNSENNFDKGDSACALYWNPIGLEPGEQHTFETQYGLGDFSTQQEGEFLATVKAPYKVEEAESGVLSKAIKISLELDNTLSKSKRMLETKAQLLLPEGIGVQESGSNEQKFGTVERGQLSTKQWSIEVPYAEESKVYEYSISISTLGVEQQVINKKIFVPGRHEGLPEVFYTDYGPKILSSQDSSKIILLKGKGFKLLKDKETWDIEVTKKGQQSPTYVDKNLLQIIDDETIQITLRDLVEEADGEASYDLFLNHKVDDRLDYRFFDGITITRSSAYLPRIFESIAIYEEVVSGKKYYSLDRGKGTKMMEIRGAVTEVIPGESYSIEGSTPVKIHDNLYYQGEDLLIKLGATAGENKKDQLLIKGKGRLSAKLGNRDDSRAVLLSGRLLYDPSSYFFQLDKTVAREDKIVQLGYLPLIIRGVELRGSEDIEIKADFALDTKRIDSLLGEFTPEPITTSLEGIRLKKEGLFYKDRVAISLPPMRIGGFRTKPGTPTYLFIDTERNSYGFATTWMNRSLGLDSLVGKLLFNERWEPTSIQLKSIFKKPRPIGQSGMGIKYLDGGVYGLDKAWKQNISDMELRAGFGVEDMLSGSASIGSFRLLDGDVRGILNGQGLNFNGQGNLLTIPITDMAGYVSRRGANIQGNLDILGMIDGTSTVAVEPNYLGGQLDGNFSIPSGLPIIGGEKVGGFQAGFSTDSLYSSFELLRCDIGVTYVWGEADVDIEVDTPSLFGTNILALPKDAFVYEGDVTNLGMELSYTETVKVEDKENLLFQLGYNGERPPFIQVEDPLGNPYTLHWRGEDANPNALHQIIGAEDSLTGKEERYVGFSVKQPMEGIWKVVTDQKVTTKVYEIKELPDIKELKIQKKSSSLLEASWTSTQKDVTLNFYLVPEGPLQEIRELKTDILSSEGKILLEVPKATATGTYQILVKARRGTYGYREVHSKSFNLVNPLEPKRPRGFKVESVGNGTLRASWQATSDRPTRYLIRPTNWDKDKALQGAVVYAEGTANQVRFGGILQDDKGEAYGWLTGRDYELEIIGIKKDEEGLEHYSQPALSQVYLPEIKAPRVQIDFQLREGKLVKEEDREDVEVFLSNGDYVEWVFGAMSGNATNYRIVQNGVTVSQGDLANKSGSFLLKEGENHLRIEVMNDRDEVGIRDFIFYCDTQQPYLFLQSPKPLTLIQGNAIQVQGQTEKRAKLSVNGENVPVSSDGSFNTTIQTESLKNMEIRIEAEDLSGNKVEYRQQLLLAPKRIKKVTIIPPQSIIKGEVYRLTLMAIDDQGHEWILPQGAIKWELLEDSSGAQLTKEGQITMNQKDEEVVVKATYHLSNDYVLEDVVGLKVNGEDQPPVIDPPIPQEDEDNGSNESYEGIYIPSNKEKKVTYGKGLILRIQEGSVTKGSFLKVKRLSKMATDQLKEADMIALSPLYSLDLKGQKILNKQGILELQYKISDAYPDEQIGLYRWSGKQGWQLIGGQLDSQKGYVTGFINDMGIYGVFYNKKLKRVQDIQGRWSMDSIKRLLFQGIIQGIETEEGLYFRPEKKITRAEFIKMLAAIEQMTNRPLETNTKVNKPNASVIFADEYEIPKWAKEAISYGYEQNWLKGDRRKNQVYIHPMDLITRGEAIALLGRVIGSKEKETSYFKDWDEVPLWAQEFVEVLVHHKIIKGYEDQTLRPGHNITREEAAVMLERYLRVKSKE